MSRQSRLESLVEALINTASGFLLSVVLWQLVVGPAFGLEVSWSANFAITTIFTVTSVARSYLWRRFFDAGVHRLVARLLR